MKDVDALFLVLALSSALAITGCTNDPMGPNCPADGDCSGRVCGPDPICATSCGACLGDDACTSGGACMATAPVCPADADCAGRECGPDPVCSTSCGDCPGGGGCTGGACMACSCTGRACGADSCGTGSCGSCTGTDVCVAGTCTAAPNLPCDGCAGDVCESNADCGGGLNCYRINPTTAFCTNCSPGTGGSCSPAGACSADVNCGAGAVCDTSGVCFHACSTAADCPSGWVCYEGYACAPESLPDLDEPCEDSSFWCFPSATETNLCLLLGDDADPTALTYCSRLCTDDADCQDVWTLGCCAPLMDSTLSACVRREHCP